MNVMKRSRDATTENQRIDNAIFSMIWGYLMMTSSLALSKHGLGDLSVANNLLIVASPAHSLFMGGVWLANRAYKARRLNPVPAPPITMIQQPDPARRRGLALSTVCYIFLCTLNAALVVERLQNPALGWGYKMRLVAAINIFAYTLSRSIALVLSCFNVKVNWRVAPRPVAPTLSDASVVAPSDASFVAATNAEVAAPLITRRNQ